MLKSKLYEKQIIKEEEENKKNRDERGEIGWGNQIRSYILQPYTMVKTIVQISKPLTRVVCLMERLIFS